MGNVLLQRSQSRAQSMSIDIHSGSNSHTRPSAKSGHLCRRVVLSVGRLLCTCTRQNKTRRAPHFNTWCALCYRLPPSSCSCTDSAQVIVGGEFWGVCLVLEFSFSNAVSARSLRFITHGRRKMAHHVPQQGTVRVYMFGAQDRNLTQRASCRLTTLGT